MLILFLILTSFAVGALALLCVAMSESLESHDRSPWAIGTIVGVGVGVMLLALGLLGIDVTILAVGRGLNDDNMGNFVAASIGVACFGPLGVLLVLLGLSLRDRDSTSRLRRPAVLRVPITALAYLLCCGAPALIFPPLVGLAVGAMFTGLGYLRRNRESYLLWLLTIAAEREMPLGPELEATGEAVGGRTGSQLLGVAGRLEDGQPLGRALAHRDALVPPPTVLAARVGEQTGTLAETLRDAAIRSSGTTYQSHQAAYLTGMVTYFWVVFFLFMGIIGFCMYYIVPKFKAIFEDFDVELPPVSVLLIEVSDLFVNWWFVGLPLFLTLIAVTIVGGEISRRGLKNLSLPWLTRWFPRLDTPDVLRNLSRAVQTQTPLPAVLETMSDHHHRPHIADRLQRVLTAVESGQDTWDQLRQNGLLRAREVDLLHSTAAAGNLAWGLRDVADRIERDRSHRWQWWFEVLRPWPILILSLIAAFFALGMFLPLVRLLHELS